MSETGVARSRPSGALEWVRIATADAAAAVLLLTAGLAKVPTLAQPLTENFAWRQTQTAWTALIYHREGIDLFRPQVPVHGPPWVFGFEFPLFQALGSLLMDVGIDPDVAMRLLGLLTFLLTGWLLYRLVGRLAGTVAAVGTLIVFLFSPFGLLWGRTSLIEYLATAAAVGFLLAAVRWLDDRRPLDFGLAMIAGVAALLVKITTGAFYLLPLLAYRRADGLHGWRDWSVIALVALPAAVGRIWIAYTDALKSAAPATTFATSAELVDYNFGTVGMRFDPAVLAPIGAGLFVGLAGAGLLLWAPMAVANLRQLPQARFVAMLVISVVVLPPVVLTPLYSTQNYYPAAISPVVATLVGLGAAWGWQRRRTLIGRLGLVTGVALWLLTIILTRDYWLDSYRPIVDRDGSVPAAEFIRDRSNPEDWVVVDGRGWDPTVLYYADRRGYMLDDLRDDPGTLPALRASGDYALFVECPYEATCRIIPDR